MRIKISGTISVKETGQGVFGVTVEAWDNDLVIDDKLAKTSTDSNGFYTMSIESRYDRPDVYLLVKNKKGDLLKSTHNTVIENVEKDTTIDVAISAYTLYTFGAITEIPTDWHQAINYVKSHRKFRELTLIDGYDKNDKELQAIIEEVKTKNSVLELFKDYITELQGNRSNNAPAFAGCEKIYQYAVEAGDMNGHYYGIGIGLITANLTGRLAETGNILGSIYGTYQGENTTWIGKTIHEIDQAELDKITGGGLKPKGRIFAGVNHFAKLEYSRANQAFYWLANFWLGLDEATPQQKKEHNIDKNGGNFIAYQTKSIFPEDKRQVYRLCYRFPSQGNPFPIIWMIDEMVQAADGIFLGKLLCATRGLFQSYDPSLPSEKHGYLNWGYFLLVDDSWKLEARRLFPNLEIEIRSPHD